MWEVKYFKNYATQEAWVNKNGGRYQITRLFVNNGYAVEYRKLRYVY
jgi:hypothetical protein